MSVFFANPWGFLALGAIPAIVLIHFLREKSHRVRTSTLFLLEHVKPTTEGGFRVERFQNSLPFWMQILAACALAWLLADPRWVGAQSRQTVAVVLDSSASMQANREETLNALAERLEGWSAVADSTDWHLLETGPRRPPLYSGDSLDELLQMAQLRWEPVLGSHSFVDSLLYAKSLLPSDAGCVILVTDRVTEVPADVALFSIAEPTDNVGFSGGRFESRDGKETWRVLITNHSDSSQSRELTMLEGNREDLSAGKPLSLPRKIELAAGQSRTFTADWPSEGGDRIVLALSSDRLEIDDRLPLVKATQRPVRVANRLSGVVGELLEKMLGAAGGIDIVDEGDGETQFDLVVDRLGSDLNTHALLVAGNKPADETASAEEAAGKQGYDPAWVAAEDHPLVRDLSWRGLLSGPAGDLSLTSADTPLLWKDSRPLAFLRPTQLGDGRVGETLVLNWDIENSNAMRTPAVVVLLTRFTQRVREQVLRSWAENFDTGQAIALPDARSARAPEQPGFFTIQLSGTATDPSLANTTNGDDPVELADSMVEKAVPPTLEGAAQFADSRECDLRDSSPIDTVDSLRKESVLKRSIEDPWAPLWVAATAAALMVSWSWRKQ